VFFHETTVTEEDTRAPSEYLGATEMELPRMSPNWRSWGDRESLPAMRACHPDETGYEARLWPELVRLSDPMMMRCYRSGRLGQRSCQEDAGSHTL
jgi:hypothetical protein